MATEATTERHELNIRSEAGTSNFGDIIKVLNSLETNANHKGSTIAYAGIIYRPPCTVDFIDQYRW